MRALTADYDVTTYAWKFNLPGCMRLWPFYFWVVSTGDTGLGLGRVNLVCVATERSLLTTSTLLQQVKNKHLLLHCGQQFYYGQIAQFNIFDPFPFSNCTLDFTYVTAANQLPRKEPKIQISPQLGRELRPSLGLVSCIVQFHAAQNKSGL
jgi:hypothetical protein